MKQLVYLAGIILFFSCQNLELPDEATRPTDDEGNLLIQAFDVPDGFNYELTEKVKIRIGAINNDANALAGVPVNVHIPMGDSLFSFRSGFTNEEGVYEEELDIDVNTNRLVLTTPYIGFPDTTIIPIDGGVVEYTLGEENLPGYDGQTGDHEWGLY